VLLQKDVVGENKDSLRRIMIPMSILIEQFSSYNGLIPLVDENEETLVTNVDSDETERATSALGLVGSFIGKTGKNWQKATSVLSTEELAALWHLPHKDFTSPEIAWAPIRRPAPLELINNKEGVLIGDNVSSSRRHPIFLPEDSRETHLSIAGKTGVGKSTLMHNLVSQDIRDGKGVGVVDPHGKLVSDILRYSIPDERIDDVVVIDIANEEYPPPLNPLVIPGERDSVAAGQVVAV
jgi:hypothetical protein